MFRGVLLATATLVALAGPAAAGERSWWGCLWTRLRPAACCPDDYCGKPQPCLPGWYCPKGCDDYAGKPLPCVPPCHRSKGCDDYAGKPPPCWPCWPPVAAQCPPGDGCGRKPGLPAASGTRGR